MKVYLRTLGCRANHYDSEAVRALVESGGHEIVSSPLGADFAVVNSCAVTADAEAELRKLIRRTAREQPSVQTIIMGCAAALEGDRAPAARLRSLPRVTEVIAGADLPAIGAALGVSVQMAGPRTYQQATTRAVLRVQDGCDEHCTFCATTSARGANRSRPVDELAREAALLAEHHSEIVITGIHIGSYGADLGSSLGVLLERLVRDLPRTRFRLSSIEATEVDDRLFELIAGAPAHLAPHLHAPLQSGSDRVLRRMGRHWYTAGQYAAAVERLAHAAGCLGLGADLIAGFPGETAADHASSVALAERLPFTYLHVFPFSLRPGTPAERFPASERVPQAEVDRRSRELRELAARKATAYAAHRAGGQADVIVIGAGNGVGDREALSGDYLTVRPLDSALPRGARFTARLTYEQGRLLAHHVDP